MKEETSSLPHKPHILLLGVISILLCSSYFIASDMYVPSLPSMMQTFSTSSTMARMTVAFFLIALAISQLFYGPASDKLGRKKIILIGGGVYLAGCILCIFAWNIEALLVGRVIQGIGTGALLPLSRSIVQDSVSKEKFIHIVGWLSLFLMLAPAGAPVIGGIIQTYFSWRISFLVMLLLVLATLSLTAAALPETHPTHKRNPHALKPKHLLKNYIEILTHAPFVVYTFCMIAGFSGLISFYTVGPFILINTYHFTPQEFGYCAIIIISFAIIARLYMSMISLKRFGSTKTLFQGLTLMVIASTSLLISASFSSVGYKSLIASVTLYAMGASMVGPTVVGMALSFFRHKAGAASAAYGFLQMTGLFITSSIAAVIPPVIFDYSLITSTMSILAFALLSILIFTQHKKQFNSDAISTD